MASFAPHNDIAGVSNDSGDPRLPVAIVTGFLGSGKTTILNRLLKTPRLAGTLVIVNEFGEVGLDHLLIEAPEDEVFLLKDGCLCCAVLGDLVTTLTRLIDRRDAGEIAPFERIVIETSGMADPTPLLQTVVTDAFLSERLRLSTVLTVVDAVNGCNCVEKHFESVKQVVAADRILVSKTDIATADSIHAVSNALKRLNPGAEIVVGAPEGDDVASLVAAPDAVAETKSWMKVSHAAHHDGHGHDHDHGHGHGHHHGHSHADSHGDAGSQVFTVSVTHDAPVAPDGLRLWMNALSRFKGPKLLRIKGLVNVNGAPYAVNAVQRVFHEPVLLDRWPSDDTRTRIVFIAVDLDQEDLAKTTEALGFRTTAEDRIEGLEFGAADYQRFISALGGFSVQDRI